MNRAVLKGQGWQFSCFCSSYAWQTFPFWRALQMNVISNTCSYSLAMSSSLFERESRMAVAARRSCIEWSRPFAPHLMSYTIESCLAFVKPAARRRRDRGSQVVTDIFFVVTAFLYIALHCYHRKSKKFPHEEHCLFEDIARHNSYRWVTDGRLR